MRHKTDEWVQCHQKVRGQPDPPYWAQIWRVYNTHMDVQAPGRAMLRVARGACSQVSVKSIPT